ncbi:MAG: hypothetical protein RIE73_10005 [Coleofasciculus sp. C1-SOL-03]|uniref:hypothetical protein n=1 Tax=Coleofasciculus sp. C1-SOL-03 TaxID=3069522 RepID=UPI0032F8A3A4
MNAILVFIVPDKYLDITSVHCIAEGRRQKAGGRRQKAEGRRLIIDTSPFQPFNMCLD